MNGRPHDFSGRGMVELIFELGVLFCVFIAVSCLVDYFRHKKRTGRSDREALFMGAGLLVFAAVAAYVRWRIL